MNHWIENFDPIKFAKEKSYAERIGWTKVRWLNGGMIGHPPSRPWIHDWKEYQIPTPFGQLELFSDS